MPYLRQVYNDGLGCASYVLGCPTSGTCAVVDPKEDPADYLFMARMKETRITHVIETHVHADHISGARRLVEATGAKMYLHESADVKYHFEPLRDKQTLDVGNIGLRVLHTPGHTPESISLLYTDKTRSSSPWAVLTGDTLFVGDVGRLDLVGAGTQEQMYDSLFKKLLSLDDYVEVYPAHYAGSVCGNRMSPKTVSTIGFERMFNLALKAKTEEEFATYLRANAPVPFSEASKIKSRNEGRE